MSDLYPRIRAAVAGNPVRTLGYAAALVIVAASAITGTPLAVILGEVATFTAAVERIRAAVTPMSRVLVHVNDLADEEA